MNTNTDSLNTCASESSGLLTFSFTDMKSVHGVSSSPSLAHFSVAVSSIAMHLEKFLRRVNVEQDMEDFAKKYEYSLIVLMGINTNIKGKSLNYSPVVR